MENSAVFNSVATIIIVDLAFAMLTGMTGLHGAIVDGGAWIGDQVGIEPLFEHAHHTGHTGDLAYDFNHTGTHDHNHYTYDYNVPQSETFHQSHAHPPTDSSNAVSDLGGQQNAAGAAGAHGSPACYDAAKGVINLDNGLVYDVDKEVFLKNGAVPMFQNMLMSHAVEAHPEFSQILDSLAANSSQTLSAPLACP